MERLRLKLLALLVFALLPTCYGGTVTGTLQGPSGLPVKGATLTFQLNQTGLILGSGNVASLTSSCYTDPTGNVVGLPAPTVLPIVAVGSGSLPGGTYYVEQTFVNAAGGESTASPELQIQLASTGSLVIAPPVTVPAIATGLRIYIGTAQGAETLQGTQGPTSTYTQGSALATGTAPPTTNSSVCTIAFNDTIIPYGGYNVSLISANGNAYPGWPQSWQLNGGAAGTVNVSQGAPLWNGTVIYPQPIVAQPLNHGPQSISGPLDFGRYNVTNVGTSTAGSVNGVINPAMQAGAEIGAQVNASLALCGSQCEIHIPAGSYTQTTQIVLPLNFFSQFRLTGDPGARVTYTGTGDAILSTVAGGPTEGNCLISGFQLYGNSAATSGIHIQPTNTCRVTQMLIQGFTGGSGVWMEGVNAASIDHNAIFSNKNGVLLSPTLCNGAVCAPSGSGAPYAPNAIHIAYNSIASNSQWGILSTDPVTAGLSGAVNDEVMGNDLELNGSAGVGYGALSFGRSTGLVIQNNYFENSPRQIVLGITGGGSFFASVGPVIRDNYFTMLTNAPGGLASPYSIELQNTISALIEGNSAVYGSATSATCFVNGTGESQTVVGANYIPISGPGSLLCESGSYVQQLTGIRSYSTQNTRYVVGIVYANYIVTSAGTSETVSAGNTQVGPITPSSACFVTPAQSTAVSITPVGVVAGTGTLTFYHPTGAVGTQWNIYCAVGPFQ